MKFNNEIDTVVEQSTALKNKIKTALMELPDFHPAARPLAKNCCVVSFSALKGKFSPSDFMWYGIKTELLSIVDKTSVEHLKIRFQNIIKDKWLPENGNLHEAVVNFLESLIK